MNRAVLSRMEAANYLGISTDTLDRLRAAGAIVAAQVSARLVKYRAADLDAYIAQCQTQPFYAVGKALGQTVASTTERYAKLAPEDVAAVMEAVRRK